MENKVTTLKDIRRKSHELDPGSKGFDHQFESLAKQALECMEGINDMQEKKWIEKGLNITTGSGGDSSIGEEERDKALSYLKEAVHTVILREENYRE